MTMMTAEQWDHAQTMSDAELERRSALWQARAEAREAKRPYLTRIGISPEDQDRVTAHLFGLAQDFQAIRDARCPARSTSSTP